MNIFLEKNCQNLLRRIRESGHSYIDIIEDPIYCIFGQIYSSKDVEDFAKEYNKEIDAAIKFANNVYNANIKESNLVSIEEKIRLAVKYLGLELEWSDTVIGDKLS